jgi:hypothetical protein
VSLPPPPWESHRVLPEDALYQANPDADTGPLHVGAPDEYDGDEGADFQADVEEPQPLRKLAPATGCRPTIRRTTTTQAPRSPPSTIRTQKRGRRPTVHPRTNTTPSGPVHRAADG